MTGSQMALASLLMVSDRFVGPGPPVSAVIQVVFAHFCDGGLKSYKFLGSSMRKARALRFGVLKYA